MQADNRQIGLCQSHLNVMDQIIEERELTVLLKLLLSRECLGTSGGVHGR
jgi:hypothetical protein